MSSTSLDPRLGQLWRAARAPVLICGLVLLVALGVAAATDRQNHGLLDPTAVDDSGSGALAGLLREQGVDVRVARRPEEIRAAGPGSTVFVPFPQQLTADQQAAVRSSAADRVVVAPGGGTETLVPGVAVGAHAAVASTEPRCALPAALAAGAADLGGELYRTRAPGAVRCYPRQDGAALVVVPGRGDTVTVVGTSAPFTNGALADNGNAALALHLLGGHRQLLWYLPAPETMTGQGRPLVDLVPRGWLWGAAQLAVAALLVAVWRGRRLGPVVAEPLPVVVRAAETVEGRGRLYRRAGARGHAAEVLREATLHRLRPLLGMESGAPAVAVVDAVAARCGRPPAQVRELLFGAAPEDDVGLVRLADGLDAVDREVRRS
ncbi:MAG TPA: DUF4350 domain-containing protein [Pseudonocardiaceae bacterium]